MSQLADKLLIRKDLFHSALGIVKVAFHRGHIYIVALLGYHLPFLNLADSVTGIKHHDFGARYVLESCQGSFAGIAGSSHQDQYLPGFIGFFGTVCHQVRQDLQCHIFKSLGRPMP